MDSDPKRVRFRTWLRRNTHFKNTDEFFVAILFEGGIPPHPITKTYVTSRGRLMDKAGTYTEMSQWRNRISTIMSERLHHQVDPTVAVQEYLKWLLAKQESRSMYVR